MGTRQALGCKVISPGKTYEGKQGLTYLAGVSAQTAGAHGICMHMVTFPPGGREKTHLHENHETAILILSGKCEVWYGEELQEHLVAHEGDFIYIPEGVPHLPANLSQTEPCKAVVARTDPHEQDSVVLLSDRGCKASDHTSRTPRPPPITQGSDD